MKMLIRFRWLIVLAWLAGLLALQMTAPDMARLVREKGQFRIPEGYSSAVAAKLQNLQNGERGDTVSLVLVFHNGKGLKPADMREIEKTVRKLEDQRARLGTSRIASILDNDQVKEQLIAKDHRTVLTMLDVKTGGLNIQEIRRRLKDSLRDCTVPHYLTGSALANEDIVLSSEAGLKKTEWITILFILVVLILVFRSPVAPFIPLLTVGLAYAASSAIVAFLVEAFDFPLSTFTQIFLVAVLFGIGTDYCILLLSRFKEQLAGGDGVDDAIIRTYRSAGKTVGYSGVAAFAGFASIGLARFNLYQSAVAVAVGVLVLMAALATIVPFFMKVFGKGLFWPVRGTLKHGESKIWSAAGTFALQRPWLALALVAVLLIPLLLTYSGKLSFDSMNEIRSSYESVKGFQIISDSFIPGEAMPLTIVLQDKQPMDNAQALAVIEKISREIARVDHVSKVRSASRPLGEEVKDFSVRSQMESLNEGLTHGEQGLDKVRTGLSAANRSLAGSLPNLSETVLQIGKLAEAAKRMQTGAVSLQKGLHALQNGMEQGESGSEKLEDALKKLKDSADKLAAAEDRLAEAYRQMSAGLTQLTGQYADMDMNLAGVSQALQALNPNLRQLLIKYPVLKKDGDFLRIQGAIGKSQTSIGQLSGALNALNAKLKTITDALGQADSQMQALADNQRKLSGGLEQVRSGIGQLGTELGQIADRQGKMGRSLPEMIGGLGQAAEGQQRLKDGMASLTAQVRQLSQGLSDSVDGLEKVQGGINNARGYLSGISQNDQAEASGWYVPAEALKSKDFQHMLAAYMSEDRTVTTFEAILETNPYAQVSFDTARDVQAAVKRAIKGTSFEGDLFGVGGVSGQYADLREISNKDYSRTVFLMLAAILIIMAVLLRSLIMPLYLLAGLVLVYFASLAVNQIVFVQFYGNPGINWTIPFFSFVILMALGVDYSIFLMDRFNEHRREEAAKAIGMAMKKMGTVIFSAAVILAGTFAAMLPSGVQSLQQIAITVLTGLLLYAAVILPLFVPVMVRLFGKNNGWPFGKRK